MQRSTTDMKKITVVVEHVPKTREIMLFSSVIFKKRLMLYTRPAVCIKKSVTMHTPGREQILTLTLTLTLAVYHASFVYTYGRPCV